MQSISVTCSGSSQLQGHIRILRALDPDLPIKGLTPHRAVRNSVTKQNNEKTRVNMEFDTWIFSRSSDCVNTNSLPTPRLQERNAPVTLQVDRYPQNMYF